MTAALLEASRAAHRRLHLAARLALERADPDRAARRSGAAAFAPRDRAGRGRRSSAVEAGFDDGERITQFEAAIAASFVAFAEAGVEVAVVEAGLGGRLDATNVIPRPRPR